MKDSYGKMIMKYSMEFKIVQSKSSHPGSDGRHYMQVRKSISLASGSWPKDPSALARQNRELVKLSPTLFEAQKLFEFWL